MNHISIGRFDKDPSAQGVVEPEDGSWQLVIDKDGYPHLYIRVKYEKDEGGEGTAMLALDDMLDEDLQIRDLMEGTFGGKCSPEEEQQAYEEWKARKEKYSIPCPVK